MKNTLDFSLHHRKLNLLCAFIPLTLTSTTSSAEPEKVTPKQADEWKPLYKGNLDDFRIYFRGQGYIKDAKDQKVFVAKPNEIHVLKGTNGVLVTKTPYSYYHVKVDYRWGAKGGKMNAGLMTHVDLKSEQIKDNRPQSVEINMRQDAPGSVWFAASLGPFGSAHVQKGTKTYLAKDEGGLVFRASPFDKRTILARYPDGKPNSQPRGEWNTLEAIVHGSESVEIIHNGITVNRVTSLFDIKKGTKLPGGPLTEGGIGLQSEGQEVFYRNFKIKPLKR